jgi:hypothetical protein
MKQSLLTETLHFLGDKKLTTCSICWLVCETKLNRVHSLNPADTQKSILAANMAPQLIKCY